MQALLRRLQVEAARAAATPAQRLLDDALQILAGTAQIDYQARKQVRGCDQVVSPRPFTAVLAHSSPNDGTFLGITHTPCCPCEGLEAGLHGMMSHPRLAT